MEEYQSWAPLEYLSDDSGARVILIVLNQPLAPQLTLFKKLWEKAVLKVGVDGGANEIYHNTTDDREKYCPDLVTGDFDSVEPEVMQFYKNKGTEQIRTQDQNFTDFTKCLKVVSEKLEPTQYDIIVAMGAFGGRLDQVFANTETVFQAKTIVPGKPVYLVSDNSLACLLSKGKHCLSVNSGFEGNWCGLIPIAGACNCVTTTGLTWNLDHQRLKFGELVSTSNTWEGTSGQVTIETDESLLFTMGIISF